MKFPDTHSEGAGGPIDPACGNGADEILFGDARWIAERLEVLRRQSEPAPAAEGN